MGETTGITWCDSTFNTWWGCVKVSEACRSCYALAFDKRVGGSHWGPTARRRFFGEKHWAEPPKWNRLAEKNGKRARVFCSSMADVFEELPIGHPDAEAMTAARAKLFELILRTPHLDWLLLTKRPENIKRLWPHNLNGPSALFWPNVWLGTTVEDQERCVRIPILRSVPAAVHFLSCEPLLEGIPPDLTGIDWVIIGGESGGGARPFNVAWARSLVKRARAAGAAPFVKQLGAHVLDRNDAGFGGEQGGDTRWPSGVYPDDAELDRCTYQGEPVRIRLADRAGGDMSEWPLDLRVREFPQSNPKERT